MAGDEVILGREEGLDVTIRDPEVSRRHTRITWQSGNYHIEDLGSTNGTFLNGAMVTGPQALQSGDTIGVGQTLLVFQSQIAATQAQPAPSPAQQPAPPPPAPAAPPQRQQRRRGRCLLWGCGCLILLGLLLVVLSGAAMLFFAEEVQPILDDLDIPIQLTMSYVAYLLAW
jgi:hypothetical protein